MVNKILYIFTLLLIFESNNYTAYANSNENHPLEDTEENNNEEESKEELNSPWDPR